MIRQRYSMLLALCSIAGFSAPSVNAELVISAQVSEPVIVVQRRILSDGDVAPIIALPNGTNLYGNQLTVACLGQTHAIDPLLVYQLHSRRCAGLAEAAPRLGLLFLGLDTGASESTSLLNESPFLVVVPPGGASVAGLEEIIFADGFD